MCGLRRGDDNGLYLWIIDQHAPIIGRAGKTICGAIGFCAFCAARADHFQTGPQRGVEHRTNGGHGHGMSLAHIAASDNSYPNF